jgi:hypothetical protein
MINRYELILDKECIAKDEDSHDRVQLGTGRHQRRAASLNGLGALSNIERRQNHLHCDWTPNPSSIFVFGEVHIENSLRG